MRPHVPSNENTGEKYAPVYYDTRERMESVFGKSEEKFWPANDRETCSKCYSLAPSLSRQDR